MIWTRIQCLGEPAEDGTHPPIEGDLKQKSTVLLNARRGAAQEAQGSSTGAKPMYAPKKDGAGV